ncbi:hypothetical protein E4U27_004738 [Claviceps purpurea]|nr:hypothetical protein E4U27_004738 [Claviceps purpurea]
MDQQNQVDALMEHIRELEQLFTPHNRSKIRPIASEKALEILINAHVEDPVRDIINMLHSVDPSGRICEIEGVIDFIYHPKGIGDNPRRLPISELAPAHTPKFEKKTSDQMGYASLNGKQD